MSAKDDATSQKDINTKEFNYGKTVVLVRHIFADSGDVRTLYNEYLDEKIRQSSS